MWTHTRFNSLTAHIKGVLLPNMSATFLASLLLHQMWCKLFLRDLQQSQKQQRPWWWRQRINFLWSKEPKTYFDLIDWGVLFLWEFLNGLRAYVQKSRFAKIIFKCACIICQEHIFVCWLIFRTNLSWSEKGSWFFLTASRGRLLVLQKQVWLYRSLWKVWSVSGLIE